VKSKLKAPLYISSSGSASQGIFLGASSHGLHGAAVLINLLCLVAFRHPALPLCWPRCIIIAPLAVAHAQ